MKNLCKTQILRIGALGVGVFFLTFLITSELSGSGTTGRVSATFSDPREIYSTNCAICHGSDGKAKTAKGKRTGATDFTSDWNTDQARGMRIIKKGKGEMPSFNRKLNSGEIRDVFEYVVKFRP